MEESSKLKLSDPKEAIEIEKKDKPIKPIEIESQLPKDTNNSFSIPIEVKQNEEHEEVDTKMNIEPQSKNGLIIKVFGVLSIQLTITLISVYFFNIKSIKSYIIDEYYDTVESVVYNSLIIFSFLLICLSFVQNLLKIPPYNYLILFVFSLCQVLFCSLIPIVFYVHYYQTIVMGLILSIISCVIICLYTFYRKNDMDYFIIFLLILFWQILVTWLILVFLPVKEYYVLWGFCIAFCLGVYFNYDAQLMNEKYINVYTFHDYTFALLEVYTDIVRLSIKMIAIGFTKIFGKVNLSEYINI